MEGVAPNMKSVNPGSPSRCDLLIVHTAEAAEWAAYLQKILKSSRKLPRKSIVLYTVGVADRHGYNFEHFHGSKCIVPLLTAAFLELLSDPEVLGSFQRLLHPPHRVVALLCGVVEDDVPIGTFDHWQTWRKLHAEDEPVLYISTILEAINDSRRVEQESEAAANAECEFTPVTVCDERATKETGQEEEGALSETEKGQEDKDPTGSESQAMSPAHPACLTVQPSRVLCGDQVTIFIVLTNKMNDQSKMEVEFSSEHAAIKRVQGNFENEYTISVTSPDMPAGVVSLTLHSELSSVSLNPVMYYSRMGEISSFLENATAPMDFMCQAFDITSNITDSLDTLLTDSLKCRMPKSGLQLFGIRQIEEDNMATYQRNEELPTMLHFAAKYGLKKLTTVLLQCPGALQAYSVMNKNGDYPNTLAQRSGFSNLRQFMDDFIETAAMAEDEDQDVYESMFTSSRDLIKCSLNPGCQEDIYESMIQGLNPDCMEDLYEEMEAVTGEHLNPEEMLLRRFFKGGEGKPGPSQNEEYLTGEEEEGSTRFEEVEEVEEDPYDPCYPDQIYDTVDENASYVSEVFNRPPAPIPRPDTAAERESQTYISRVFSSKDKSCPDTIPEERASDPVRPVRGVDSACTSPSTHDPYAGMKTPGQRQLIALQERVKVGALSVDEAVQEFKAWKIDQERRSNSLRFQQENLKRLRNSITRRHKEREKMGKELELEITAPLPRNFGWGNNMAAECSVYDPAPRLVAPPPPVSRSLQRGTWQSESTSSTSSSGSNRLSTHSTISCSSGTEPDFEDQIDFLPPPPRPPRPVESSPLLPPTRTPPRLPDRVPESMLQERYISCPSRALPQRPAHRAASPPPIPPRGR